VLFCVFFNKCKFNDASNDKKRSDRRMETAKEEQTRWWGRLERVLKRVWEKNELVLWSTWKKQLLTLSQHLFTILHPIHTSTWFDVFVLLFSIVCIARGGSGDGGDIVIEWYWWKAVIGESTQVIPLTSGKRIYILLKASISTDWTSSNASIASVISSKSTASSSMTQMIRSFLIP